MLFETIWRFLGSHSAARADPLTARFL